MTAKKKQFKVGDQVTWTLKDKTTDTGRIVQINGDHWVDIKRENGTHTVALLTDLTLLRG
jgi:plastocyanin